MFVSMLFLGVLLSFLDLVPLFKKKEWKLFIIYSLVLLAALASGVLYALDVPLPSTAHFLKKLTTTLWRLDIDGD